MTSFSSIQQFSLYTYQNSLSRWLQPGRLHDSRRIEPNGGPSRMLLDWPRKSSKTPKQNHRQTTGQRENAFQKDSENFVAWFRRKWKEYIPETDENHTRKGFPRWWLEGIQTSHLQQHGQRDESVGWRQRQVGDSVGRRGQHSTCQHGVQLWQQCQTGRVSFQPIHSQHAMLVEWFWDTDSIRQAQGISAGELRARTVAHFDIHNTSLQP